MKFQIAALAFAALALNAGLVYAQGSTGINLSSYGGTGQDARAARAFCWDKAKLARASNPQTEAQANSIRGCIDRVLAGNMPAKDAPPAKSARGRCIQQLPGSIYNKETERYSNANVALVTEKCGAPPQ